MINMFKRKETQTIFRMRINFKSGSCIIGWFEGLSMSDREIKWRCYGDWEIIKMAFDEIESVVQLESKEV